MDFGSNVFSNSCSDIRAFIAVFQRKIKGWVGFLLLIKPAGDFLQFFLHKALDNARQVFVDPTAQQGTDFITDDVLNGDTAAFFN